MFLGLSLTTWLILLGVFATVTPIVGKQIAKDALKIKDSLQDPDLDQDFLNFILFPNELLQNDKIVWHNAPVQKFAEEIYVRRMMAGGVWVKFLLNSASMMFFFLFATFGFIVYAAIAFFRGIFSPK